MHGPSRMPMLQLDRSHFSNLLWRPNCLSMPRESFSGAIRTNNTWYVITCSFCPFDIGFHLWRKWSNNGESQCATLGASLPSVHSQEENVFIQSLHSGENGWLGLSDINTEGTFLWSDGTWLNFTYWASRQPNNFHNEDCVHTLGSLQDYRYKWNDVSCSSCHKYSCKKGIDLTFRLPFCLKYNLLGLVVSLFAAKIATWERDNFTNRGGLECNAPLN